MAEDEFTISYETLYELLRREKNRDEIQKLSESFFSELLSYLNEKRIELKKTSQNVDLFSAAGKSKVKNQIDNIVRIITELYDRREKKITMLAINKARMGSNIVDTSNFLPEEKKLFVAMVRNLQDFRSGILHNLFKGQMPFVNFCNDSFKESETSKIIENRSNNSKKENASNDVQNNKKNLVNDNSTLEKKKEDLEDDAKILGKTVKFLNAVPKFVGKELEVYGPFDEEDIASFPIAIANLLIKKGKVEEIKTKEIGQV